MQYLPAPPNCKTLLACLIVLDNLQEVLGYSKVTDFMSIIFRFSIVFGCLVFIFIMSFS